MRLIVGLSNINNTNTIFCFDLLNDIKVLSLHYASYGFIKKNI